MSIVTTNRPVDLAQLGRELAARLDLGEVPGLSSTSTETSVGIETIVRCYDKAVTQTVLDDTIDAHVPEPPPPTVEALLQEQIDELTDLLLGGL